MDEDREDDRKGMTVERCRGICTNGGKIVKCH